jgi:hypothetical protein
MPAERDWPARVPCALRPAGGSKTLMMARQFEPPKFE